MIIMDRNCNDFKFAFLKRINRKNNYVNDSLRQIKNISLDYCIFFHNDKILLVR